MDHRGSLLLTMLFCVYTLTVYATIKPVFKRQSLQNDYNFLRKLNMGYKNPEPNTDNVEVIKKNTLCGIQKICLSIMLMTVPTSNSAHTLKAKLELFNKIPRDALVMLYSINGVCDSRVFYPLWLFHLYVQDFYFYWKQITVKQMAKVHEMITKQLARSMKDCPSNNEFDVTDRYSLFYSDVSGRLCYDSVTNPTHFPKSIKQHFDEIRPTLKDLAGENYKRINAKNLLFGTNYYGQDNQFAKVEILFGKTIEWGDASSVLKEAYAKAKDPTNLYIGLRDTMKYRSLYLTVIKMVVLRMIWIHFLLVTDENNPELNCAMYETAKSFGNVIGLNDDKHYVKTVNLLRVESPTPETSKAAMVHIRSYLKDISSVFKGCHVPMLAKEDVLRIYTDLNYVVNGKTPTVIQKNHGLTEYFVEEVKRYVHTDFANSVLAMSYTIPVNF